MRFSPQGLANISVAVAASNRRRGEQDVARRLARSQWRQHKGNAKTRGVPFLLTFDEWWTVWKWSGKWHQRGTHEGQYCMSRFRDRGAYEIGNVFINLFARNTSEGVTGIKRTPEQNAARSLFMRGNKSRTGKTNSQQHRESVSKKLKGRPHTPEHTAASVAAKKRNREARLAAMQE